MPQRLVHLRGELDARGARPDDGDAQHLAGGRSGSNCARRQMLSSRCWKRSACW